MPSQHTPPGKKWSGKPSWISWANLKKKVRTNEAARSLIIMYHSQYSNKIQVCLLDIQTFYEQVLCEKVVCEPNCLFFKASATSVTYQSKHFTWNQATYVLLQVPVPCSDLTTPQGKKRGYLQVWMTWYANSSPIKQPISNLFSRSVSQSIISSGMGYTGHLLAVVIELECHFACVIPTI